MPSDSPPEPPAPTAPTPDWSVCPECRRPLHVHWTRRLPRGILRVRRCRTAECKLKGEGVRTVEELESTRA